MAPGATGTGRQRTEQLAEGAAGQAGDRRTVPTVRAGAVAEDERREKPSAKGPADWFTGDVWIDPVGQADKPSEWALNAVHFHPGARTAWHCHSGGQTLYVTEGQGLVQSRGGDIVVLRPGDVVRTPVAEWHWQGPRRSTS